MAEKKTKKITIVKKVPVKGPKGQKGYAVLRSDGKIRIDWVRFSYPHLRKPYAGDDGGEPKFGIVGLMPKKTHRAAKDLIKEVIDDLLAANKVKAIAPDKKFLRDGDHSDKDEAHGCYTVSARETRRPLLRDRRNEPIEPEEADSEIQPGYWGTILIRPWWQNNKWGKRINAGLSAVQVVAEDETFGEGGISDEELDDALDSFDDDDDGYDEDEDEDEAPRRKRRRSRDDYDEDEDEDVDI